MSSASNFRIIGLDELNRLFANLPNAFDRIFETAGKTYSKSVFEEAHKRVPVKTGYLKSRIAMHTSTKEVRISNDAPYAAAVNFGTFRMRARPFLTGPAEEYEPKLMNDLGIGLMNYLRSGTGGGT